MSLIFAHCTSLPLVDTEVNSASIQTRPPVACNLRKLLNHLNIYNYFCLLNCRTIDAVADVYRNINYSLGDKSHFGGQKDHLYSFVEQYSASYAGDDKDRIVARTVTNDPLLRCIVTTIALGMGVDMAELHNVINWGASKNILSYWQEVGRAGRDGRPAKAVMYAFPNSLRNVASDMKELIEDVKKGKCVRRQILKTLDLNYTDDTVISNDNCCSNCDKNKNVATA